MKTFLQKTIFVNKVVKVAFSFFCTLFLAGAFFVSTIYSNELNVVEIVGWNFPNDPDDAFADLGISANLSKTITATADTVGFTTAGVSTNSARATGWGDGIDTKYWQVEFDTTGYENIQLSSKQRSTDTGPKDFKIQYKVGSGGEWADVSGGEVVVANDWVSGVVTDLQLPEETENTSSVFVRWVVTSTASVKDEVIGSTGASNIDAILVTGTEISTTEILDTDTDTIADEVDNCPAISNTDQFDTESDGIGDVCDPDDDNDGIEDAPDNCQYVTNSDQADMDGDTVGDECDLDNDGDGVEDTADNCPITTNPDQVDSDENGVGDACESNSNNEILVDEIPSGSLSSWELYDHYNNPTFYYEESISPYDGTTAIKTRAVGNTIMYCSTESLTKKYTISGNSDMTKLKAYLEFTSNLTKYNLPYIVVDLLDENDNSLGHQVYYAKSIIGSYYLGIIANDPSSYTELPTATGDMVLDLSHIGENINFSKISIKISNYTCVGENSIIFDHLRVIDGEVGESDENEGESTGDETKEEEEAEEEAEEDVQEPVPPTTDVVRRGGGGSLMKIVSKPKTTSNKEVPVVDTPSKKVEQVRSVPTGSVRGAVSTQLLSDLSQGMENEQVRALQEHLRTLGFFTFPTSTGYFGSVTFQAVQAFQREYDLPVTGYVGPLTREKVSLALSQGNKKPLNVTFSEIVELFVAKGLIPANKKEQALEIVALQN